MIISQVVSAGQVWSNATRTLTGLSGAIGTAIGSDNNSLANGSTANFRTAGGVMQILSVVGFAAANVTWQAGLSNGTTFRSGVTQASGSSIFADAPCSSSLGLALSNSGTVSGNYSTAGIQFNQ